jgi:hypothetical protein
METWEPIGWARYHAGTVSLRNHAWHGFTLQSNFTYAKNLSSSRIGTSDFGNTNYRAPYVWAGPSTVTPKLWFLAAGSYETPKLSVPRAFGAVVNGWVWSGIFRTSTGAPEPVTTQDQTGTALYSPSFAMPNRVCDGNQGPGIHTRLQWFNTKCFVDAPFGVWGNSTLGAITDPGMNTWNLAAARRFAITETHRVELRADAFNAFNHTQWGPSTKNLRSVAVGRITTTRPARQVQFALRYLF